MRRARLLGKERSIVTEKALKCKGMVSVRLEVLPFPEIKTKDPTKPKNNVERLKKTFQDEGCWPLPLPNHIPAQIDKQGLDAALWLSQRSSKEPFVGSRDEYPELEFPPGYQLMCLDGQSRALAAAKVLPVVDRRWIVDLYAAGCGHVLENMFYAVGSGGGGGDGGGVVIVAASFTSHLFYRVSSSCTLQSPIPSTVVGQEDGIPIFRQWACMKGAQLPPTYCGGDVWCFVRFGG
ncbi:hypothetical protein LTR06_011038 [Exophiala xenobiotica]|nr:hypothetical protein LTR06_011038 [Exophiala xenobiotica]